MSVMHKIYFILLFTITACTPLSPLLKAAYNDDARQVDQLLQSGAQVNEQDGHGYTPLIYASQNGNPVLVERLITAGADVNLQDKSGLTAMMHAAIYGHDKIIRLLIIKGAKARAEDGVVAVNYGAYGALPLLLEAGVDTNYRDKQGMTLLHSLAQQTGADSIGSLAETVLRKGADPNIKDNIGYTPLRWAFYCSNVDVAAAIRRSPLGKEKVEDLFLSEALSVPARHTPEEGDYMIPQGENKSYQTAIIDCNFLIASNKKFLMLMLGGPVLYAGSLAVD